MAPEARDREPCFCSNCGQKRELGSAPGWGWSYGCENPLWLAPEALAGPGLIWHWLFSPHTSQVCGGGLRAPDILQVRGLPPCRQPSALPAELPL